MHILKRSWISFSFFNLCFSQSNQNTQRLNIPQNPTSALRNLALLTHVLRRIMWNWCNNCAWTSLLPKANVQSSYIRPTISSLPNTFSHVLYLLLTHTPSNNASHHPYGFAGYYEINLWEERLLAFCALKCFCGTLFNWTPTNPLDVTAPLNPLTAPSIIAVFPALGCRCGVWPLCRPRDLIHSDILWDYFKGSVHPYSNRGSIYFSI